jgi:ABC-type antimicrobial peptide transport system permease subunit
MMIEFHISFLTLAVGSGISFIFSLFVLGIAIFRQTRKPLLALFSGETARKNVPKANAFIISFILGAVCLLAALFLTIVVKTGRIEPILFFISSGLVFISLLFFIYGIMIRIARRIRGIVNRPFGLAARRLVERPGRSLVSISILALGIFIVTAVGANTSSLPVDPAERDTGTGGFSLYMETSVPVADNLNDNNTRIRLGLDEPSEQGVTFIPLRVAEGDDFSCLNLNRAQAPEILGVREDELEARQAFAFADFPASGAQISPWAALSRTLADGAIPAFADEASLTWGLGLKIGDTINVRDEQDKARVIKFVGTLSNSIFQGSILVSEKHFLELFLSSQGYTRFLVDAPEMEDAQRVALAGRLQNILRNFGAALQTTEARLFSFQQVANTYLLLFLLLGGFGLLIGIGGFGVLIQRSIAERRGEFALMLAVGFSKRTLVFIVLVQELFILFTALIVGLAAALLALYPALAEAGEKIPWGILSALVAAMAGGGFLWVWRSVTGSLKGNIIGILKNE